MRLLLAFIAAGVAVGQAPFPMKYVDEVGHLGEDVFDKRKFADLGFAKAFPDEDGLRFEGRDRAGKVWRVWMPQSGGASSTEVWTADFDHNGQPDLLIASEPALSGHCVSRADITMLLFDASGRPVPWMVSTEIPDTERREPYRPAILLDTNKDGRAEIVTTECGPWDADSVDYSVTGVYEARDTHWVPLRNADLKPYIQAAHAAHPAFRPGYIHWLPVEPEKWVDELKIVDGAPAARDREGWPGVVIDGPDGRGIYIDDTEDILGRILNAGYRFKILGKNLRPSWVWVDIH
jgi:hypothetical protein